MMLLSSDTQQHPPADARKKPGHQVRPSGDSHHHHRKIYQEGECQFRKHFAKLILCKYNTDLLLIQENLKVNPEIRTTQTESEMESAFTPGSAFVFNVILQLEKSDSDEDSEEQSDSSE